MIITSNAGNPYALIARNDDMGVGVAPSVIPFHGRIVLTVRVRIHRWSGGEIDRTKAHPLFQNGTIAYRKRTHTAGFIIPTPVKISEIGLSTASVCTEKIVSALSFLFTGEGANTSGMEIHPEAVADIAKLVRAAMVSYFPASIPDDLWGPGDSHAMTPLMFTGWRNKIDAAVSHSQGAKFSVVDGGDGNTPAEACNEPVEQGSGGFHGGATPISADATGTAEIAPDGAPTADSGAVPVTSWGAKGLFPKVTTTPVKVRLTKVITDPS